MIYNYINKYNYTDIITKIRINNKEYKVKEAKTEEEKKKR